MSGEDDDTFRLCMLFLAVFVVLLVVILGFLWAARGAYAQTTGCGSSSLSCQQLAMQDAQQYGIDQATFLAQINAESGFNPNIGCNSSNACGIAQFIPSTAAQFNLDPSDPVASLQAAAQYDAQLVSQYGSLTAALEHYSGGLTPANPGDYGPVFADAAAADAGTPVTASQQPGITVTAEPATISQAATAAGITGSAGGSGLNPYTYLYNQMQTGILNPILATITNVQTAIAPWVVSILTMSVMFMAVAGLWGKFPVDSLFYRLMRISFVVPLVAIGSPWYQTYAVGLFEGLPVQLSNAIIGAATTNPAAPFDIVLHSFNANDANTIWDFPWWVPSGFASSIKLGLAWLILAIFVSFMFAAWASVQILLAVALMLGPIFVLGWLFDTFTPWANRWVNACLMLGAANVATTAVTSFFLRVINGYIGQINTTQGSGTGTTYNLIGVVVIIISLSTATAALTRLVQFIAAADGAPSMAGFQRFISAMERGAAKAAEVAVTAFAK